MMTYEKRLDELWRNAMRPRRRNAFTAVSLFAGGGGSLLGTAAAGFRELLAVEKDALAVQVLNDNFPEVEIHHGDIRGLSVKDALRLSGLKRGELDYLDMSPPCNGFSLAGDRAVENPLNNLWREGARLLDGTRPRCFSCENVTGLIAGKMRPTFEEMLAGFRRTGYKNTKWQILDASLYGVPQKRRRVIVRGTRDDLARRGIVPTLALEDHHLTRVPQAFAGLPAWLPRVAPRAGLATIAHLIPPGGDGAEVPGHDSHWNSYRLHWDEPSNTMCASAGQPSCCLLLHPDLNLGVSVREAMRLQGFPDGFRLAGTYAQRIHQLGNSVPPILAYAIGFYGRRDRHSLEIRRGSVTRVVCRRSCRAIRARRQWACTRDSERPYNG